MNPGIEVGLLSIPFEPMFLAACFLFLVASPSDRWNSFIKKSYSASDIWMRSSELQEIYIWFWKILKDVSFIVHPITGGCTKHRKLEYLTGTFMLFGSSFSSLVFDDTCLLTTTSIVNIETRHNKRLFLKTSISRI